ncbi:hypothetical protein WA588_004475, partial [Blastocystis sp. NMH]
MTDYSDSTHRNHWIFSKEDLCRIRTENHDRIVRSIIMKQKSMPTTDTESVTSEPASKQKSAETPERPPSISLSTTPLVTPPNIEPASGPASAEVDVTPEEIAKYITVNEERVLLNHFISKLFEMFPRYPHGKINYRSVQIFAASYVKRFFITRSVLQYNPKTICAAAFLLAVKADDYTPIDADTLGGLFSEATADIIEAEQKLMYGIHYEIYIHTPYRICRALDAALHELSKTEAFSSVLTEACLQQIGKSVDSILTSLYQTDLDLLFDPSLLSLYVYHSALKSVDNGEALFAKVLEHVRAWGTESQNNSVNTTNVSEQIVRVQTEFNAYKTMMAEINLKHVNRKWKRQREYNREVPHPRDPSAVLSQEARESVLSSQTMQSVSSQKER